MYLNNNHKVIDCFMFTYAIYYPLFLVPDHKLAVEAAAKNTDCLVSNLKVITDTLHPEKRKHTMIIIKFLL